MNEILFSVSKYERIAFTIDMDTLSFAFRIEDDNARNWYMEECIRSAWSSRQLEWQISTLYYERLLAEELQRETEEERRKIEEQE